MYDSPMLGKAIACLSEFMEKIGKKIGYSKGLPQSFISDIMDEEISLYEGNEEKKSLLYDDFRGGTKASLLDKSVKA